VNPRILTPLVSAGAAWGTKKAMNAVYAKRHDGALPTRDDTDVPFARVLVWALATAVVVALVDVAIQQGIARYENRQITAS